MKARTWPKRKIHVHGLYANCENCERTSEASTRRVYWNFSFSFFLQNILLCVLIDKNDHHAEMCGYSDSCKGGVLRRYARRSQTNRDRALICLLRTSRKPRAKFASFLIERKRHDLLLR